MFFRKRRERKQAEGVLKLLHHAWMEVRPDRFEMLDDAVLFLQPKIVTLNLLCGTGESERFSTISLETIYEAVVRYEKAGHIETIMNAAILSEDIVTGALICACRREYELREKQNLPETDLDLQIIESAQKVVGCLNQGATHGRRKRSN